MPHISFVSGEKDVAYLRKRFAALRGHHLFAGMEYTEDQYEMEEWMPLIMQKRDDTIPAAATKMDGGTDVDFGALTRMLIAHLKSQPGVSLHLRQRITDVQRDADQHWKLTVQDRTSGTKYPVRAKFVSSGRAAARCRCCKSRAFPRAKASAVFR